MKIYQLWIVSEYYEDSNTLYGTYLSKEKAEKIMLALKWLQRKDRKQAKRCEKCTEYKTVKPKRRACYIQDLDVYKECTNFLHRHDISFDSYLIKEEEVIL